MPKSRKRQPSSESKKNPRGRPKATGISVQGLNIIPLLRERFVISGEILTYRDIAQELTRRSGVPVSVGTIYRMGKNPPEEPHRNSLRRALGLIELRNGRVCPVHNKVHDRICTTHHSIPRPRTNWKRLHLMLVGLWANGYLADS